MNQYSGPLHVDRVDNVLTGGVVLAVVGELDLATVAIFNGAVHAALGSARTLLLELSGLGFCDSTGLGAFVSLHHAAEAAGVRLGVVAPRRQVADALGLSGVDRILGVYPSLSAALRELGADS